MTELVDELDRALASQRHLASVALPTGLHELDHATGGIPLGSLVLVAAETPLRDQFALQFAVEAIGRGRSTVVVSPFEAADAALAKVMFMPYHLSILEVVAGASDRLPWVEHDLAALAPRLPLRVVGAEGSWAERTQHVLIEGPTDLLVLLDVDAATEGAAVIADSARWHPVGGAPLPMALRRMARVSRMAVVVTMPPAALAADPDWVRAADLTLTLTPPHPWEFTHACVLRCEGFPHRPHWETRLQANHAGWLSDLADRTAPAAQAAPSTEEAAASSVFAPEAKSERRLTWLREHSVDLAERDLRELRAGQSVRAAGMVIELQRKITQGGDPWAMLTLQAGDTRWRCLAFPTAWATGDPSTLQTGSLITVYGRVVDLANDTEIHVISWGHHPPEATPAEDHEPAEDG